MANSKISALTPASTPLAGTETLPIVQSGVTVKVAVSDLTAGRAISSTGLLVNTASQINFSAISVLTIASAWGIGVKAYASTSELFTGVSTTGSSVFIVKGTGEITTADNLVVNTAAKGINFTANTPAAGMTSRLLNWYEEGTWTPNKGQCTVVGTFSSSGTYTRVGRVVTLRLNLSGSTSITCATGAQVTTNLPYASSTDTPALYINGGFSVSGAVDTSGTIMYAVGTIATTNSIIITATYQV